MFFQCLVKNYKLLLEKLSPLLKPRGLMFVHIFVSRVHPGHYVVNSDLDWMTKYFFEGGTMPSEDTLLYFQEQMVLRHHNEAESLNAVQKLDWEWKLSELNEVNNTVDDLYIPMVRVSDEFCLSVQ